MELKTNYQYTYFIYPFMVKEEKYDKYILKLLKDKKVNLKIFEKEKDLKLYTHFYPYIREFLFSTFEFTKEKTKKLLELDNELKSVMISKNPCNVFEYEIGHDAQGKIGDVEGIFFKIEKIEIVCFNTGVCFICIKTFLENSDKFSELLNFNYKFRDINSEFADLKEYQNIKIQTNSLSEMKELGDIIAEITGENKKTDIYDKFFTYSYACIDSKDWNDKNSFEEIKNDFLKYLQALPYQYNLNFDKQESNFNILSNWEYIKYGFSKQAGVVMTSNSDIYNYTKLPYKYENEYLYTLIICLYQKIYLTQIATKLKERRNVKKIMKQFTEFTKNIWLKTITNEEAGNAIYKEWRKILELEEQYNEVKEKYDLIYKQMNVDKGKYVNKVIIAVLAISLLLNITNLMTLLKL